MKNLFLTKNDIAYHFKKNSEFYIGFIIVLVLAIIASSIIVISSDGYLNLIVTSNKNFYSLVNGTAVLSEIFWHRFLNFLLPTILVILLGLNFYLALFSYVIVGYQFSIFVFTIFAVIDMYGFAGVINSLLLIIPLNLLFFANLIFLSVVCLERSKLASRYKSFGEGYSEFYFIKVLICLIVCFVLSLVVAFVYPLILKSAIFSIY